MAKKKKNINEEPVILGAKTHENVKEVVKLEIIKKDKNVEYIEQSFFKKNKRKILFGFIVTFLIAFVILAINLMGLFVRVQSEQEIPIVYMKDDEVKFISSRKRKATSLGEYEANSVYGEVKYSKKTDKYILYSAQNNLYLAKVRGKSTYEKIANDVVDYQFSSEDNYVVYINKKGDLFSYNFKEHIKLDSDVKAIEMVSKDKVFYNKDDSLYYKELKGSNITQEKIAADYSLAELNGSETKVLYSKRVDNKSNDFYVYDIKSKKEDKILSGVLKIYDYNDTFTELIYGKVSDNSIKVSDFVDDDKREEDEKFKSYSFDDYWDGRIDYDTYKNAQKEQSLVDNRNKIRKSLEELTLDDLVNMDIYYKKRKKDTKLAENVKEISYSDLGDKNIIYVKDDYSKLEKISLSEVSSIDDVKAYIINNLKSVVAFSTIDNIEQIITTGKKDVEASVIDDEVYCEADGEVISAKINKKKIQNVVTLGKNGKIVDWNSQYKDGVVYFENVNGVLGDLKIVKNGKIINVDESVYTDNLNVTWNHIYYFKDYKNNNGDYYDFNGKSKNILKDVSDAFFVKNNYMYILKDYSSKKGTYDLYRYIGKRLELVDKDVKILGTFEETEIDE